MAMLWQTLLSLEVYSIPCILNHICSGSWITQFHWCPRPENQRCTLLCQQSCLLFHSIGILILWVHVVEKRRKRIYDWLLELFRVMRNSFLLYSINNWYNEWWSYGYMQNNILLQYDDVTGQNSFPDKSIQKS